MARWLALALFFLSASAPTRTRACWDGVFARVGNVELMDGDETWSEARVVELATWLGRIDALLPPDASLRIEWGLVTLVAEEEVVIGWEGRSYEGLFAALATALATPPIERAEARRTATPVYVIQVGSFADPARAAARAASVAHTGAHGFVEVGGFPADNPTAHVTTSPAGAYRVVIGAFLDRDEAEAEARALGDGAFVRRLRS